MKKFKKVASLALVAALAVSSLTACGGSGNALGVNYNTVDAKTGLLPVLPSQNQIN